MRVLITGATGLIGRRITALCHEKGIIVNYLTTRKKKIEHRENYRGFYWNPAKGEVDPECLEGVGAIINLSGASVFQPWTKKARKKILDSRIESLEVLHRLLTQNEHLVGQLVSASAVGIYPDSDHKMYTEEEQTTADDFLGKVVSQWEERATSFRDLGLRVALVRIGLVLSNDGGALPQLERPLKYNLGAPLGTGKQWQSWIHIEDLARVFLYAIEHGLDGVYNAVAPNPVTNEELTRQVARVMDRKIWLPNLPASILKLVMGEMSTMVLGSQLVSSKKLEESGFRFYHVNLERILKDLWQQKTGTVAG